MKAEKKLFAWILGLALAIRLIAAASYLSWNHPDEWYQTVEFANWLSRGWMTYSQEMDFHLRNLSWPAILAIPLQLWHRSGAESLRLKIWLLQSWVGILDLGILWGFWQLASARGFSLAAKTFGAGLLLILPFLVHDSVRPSAEQAATIALWVCLGLTARSHWALAGLASVAILAFKYPAALLSLGIFIAVCANFLPKKDFRAPGKFLIGVAAGILLFGLADFLVYGRFWESFWMYLQYNLFTPLGRQSFGNQSALVYWDYFRSHWLGLLFPLGAAVLVFGIAGFAQALKEKEPWAFAFLFYLLGHLLVAHKEPRFVAPLEILLVWGALAYGLTILKKRKLPGKKWLALPAVYLGLLFIRALWGETGTLPTSYLSASARIRRETCAVVTEKRVSSVEYPEQTLRKMRSVALGYFPAERRKPSFGQAAQKPLVWSESSAHCEPEQTFLLEVDRMDPQWEAQGCQRLTPQWLHGPWYSCPADVLGVFKSQKIEHPLRSEIRRFEKLPKLGATSADILRMAQDQNRGSCDWLCGSTIRPPGASQPTEAAP